MTDWTHETQRLSAPDGRRLRILANGEPLTFAAVIELLAENAGFRAFLNDTLAALPFAAFRWETPPVTQVTSARAFEFVVLDSPELLRSPQPGAFAEQFGERRAPGVIGFPNLGGDAFMVAPCPGEPLTAYAHLGAFTRHAAAEQRERLWQTVGTALDAHLGRAPVWLNTAGAGVAWLHVRLDARPKYYRHAPYRLEGR